MILNSVKKQMKKFICFFILNYDFFIYNGMTTKLVKQKVLTIRDIEILQTYILCNYEKIATYDRLFPQKIMVSKNVKTGYFRPLLEGKKELCLEYFDNYYKNKFKNLFLSKERVLTDVMETIHLARLNGEYQVAINGYKLLSDLLGLRILKGQIDINQTSLVLHYHTPLPESTNDVVLKINDKLLGD